MQKLDFELNNLKSEFSELTEKHTITSKEHFFYKNGYIQWRERALMQHEDYNQLISKSAIDKQLISKLQEQTRVLKGKVDKYILRRSKEVDVDRDDQRFKADLQTFDESTHTFMQDKTYIRQILKEMDEEEVQKIAPDPLRLKIIENWKMSWNKIEVSASSEQQQQQHNTMQSTPSHPGSI